MSHQKRSVPRPVRTCNCRIWKPDAFALKCCKATFGGLFIGVLSDNAPMDWMTSILLLANLACWCFLWRQEGRGHSAMDQWGQAH